MSTPDCSIVIRAYNEEQHLGRLLSGIERQVGLRAETILVDSGSTDRTVEIASQFAVSVLSISPSEFTFGRSLNLGCSKARGEFIVLASAHVYPVYPDWLQRLLDPFQDQRVALTYGKQRGSRSTRFSEQQVFATLFPEHPPTRLEHPFCNNANAAIRRELWRQRAYDEELPGLEDLEWGAWAIAQGRQLNYVPEAEVIHVHDETPRQVYNRYKREAIALSRIWPSERFSLAEFVKLYLSNVANDAWQAGRRKVLIRELWGILWFRWMQFGGTYRGFGHRGPLTTELKRALYYPPRRQAARSAPPREVAPLEYGHPLGDPPES